MLSPKQKIIILIVGAVIVFGIIVSTVFDLWPGQKKEVPAPETVDLSFLKKDEALPAGQVFDASNKEAFAALTGDSKLESDMTPLEKDARAVAEFFVERFATYSSDSGWAALDDLQSFMTASMQNWTTRFKAASPRREGYYATTAEVAATENLFFSAAEQRAQFSLLINRTETSGGKTDNYQQIATVELRQDDSGAWKMHSLFWGDKL